MSNSGNKDQELLEKNRLNDEIEQLHKKFLPLYVELEGEATYPRKRPLLAHYTSIQTLERMMTTDELWFANPLYMDDLEELRFGILEGIQQVTNSSKIEEACETRARAQIFFDAFNHYISQFTDEHALDVYVFCMSEHNREDTDGLLSMWRGYGGNGKGAAIVIDTGQMNATSSSPLILSHVEYASRQLRLEWLARKIEQFAVLLKGLRLPDGNLYVAAWEIFQRIKLFALYTKHHGFSEEREWRVVYFKERDLNQKLASMMSYSIGARGVEPKLKFKVAPLDGVTTSDLSLSKIVHKIILGPSVSSPLAKSALLRMLEKCGKGDLMDRVVASTIPFRAGGMV